MNEYAVLIAARMTSERLPGKALAVYDPAGRVTNLEQIIERWRVFSRRQPAIIVATTIEAADNPIVEVCQALSVPCWRGSRDDVLGRLDGALRAYAPEACFVARGMSDSPLVDVELADQRFDRLVDTGADGFDLDEIDVARLTYAATTDIWSRAGWDTIVRDSTGDEREHAGAYFWNHIERFNVIPYPLPRREYLTPVRTELDTERDLELFRQVWRAWTAGFNLWLQRPTVTPPTRWALDWLADHPDVAAINQDVELKSQSQAHWSHGSTFRCKRCRRRVGSIVEGHLRIPCRHCGSSAKFYADRPERARNYLPSLGRY